MEEVFKEATPNEEWDKLSKEVMTVQLSNEEEATKEAPNEEREEERKEAYPSKVLDVNLKTHLGKCTSADEILALYDREREVISRGSNRQESGVYL